MMQLAKGIGLAVLFFSANPILSAQVRGPEHVRLSPEVAQKRIVKHVNPTYTAEMRRNHIQGIVKLKIRVTKQGDVRTADLLSGNPELGASAMDAVKQWKYHPFVLNGNAVEFETTVDINFSLAGS